jgi:hypothetical protein
VPLTKALNILSKELTNLIFKQSKFLQKFYLNDFGFLIKQHTTHSN